MKRRNLSELGSKSLDCSKLGGADAEDDLDCGEDRRHLHFFQYF